MHSLCFSNRNTDADGNLKGEEGETVKDDNGNRRAYTHSLYTACSSFKFLYNTTEILIACALKAKCTSPACIHNAIFPSIKIRPFISRSFLLKRLYIAYCYTKHNRLSLLLYSTQKHPH